MKRFFLQLLLNINFEIDEGSKVSLAAIKPSKQ